MEIVKVVFGRYLWSVSGARLIYINRILFIFNAWLSVKFSDKLCVNNKNYCEAAWLNCIASSNTFKLDFFQLKCLR